MIWLNKVNGADLIETKYFEKCLKEFSGELIGVVMGSAYGGSLEAMGSTWKDRGVVYGYDVFEDTHPKHLSDDQSDHEATCMEHWYRSDIYGTDKLNYDYQLLELKSLGINNVVLIKGEVSPNSCENLPYINYAFLDMDILKSMDNGYQAVKNIIVDGGYLLMHDVTGNLRKLIPWYESIRKSDLWEVVEEIPESMIVVLKRRNHGKLSND